MDNKILSPLMMETKFDHNSTDYIKLKLLQGNLHNTLTKIDHLKERVKYINQEIADIIGNNLMAQYLQNHEPCAGQIIVNSEFNYVYAVGQDFRLRCINKEIANEK